MTSTLCKSYYYYYYYYYYYVLCLILFLLSLSLSKLCSPSSSHEGLTEYVVLIVVVVLFVVRG